MWAGIQWEQKEQRQSMQKRSCSFFFVFGWTMQLRKNMVLYIAITHGGTTAYFSCEIIISPLVIMRKKPEKYFYEKSHETRDRWRIYMCTLFDAWSRLMPTVFFMFFFFPFKTESRYLTSLSLKEYKRTYTAS